MLRLATLLAAVLAASPAAAIDSPGIAVLHYRELQEARYAVEGVSVPKEGIDLAVDTAAFHLESGTVQTMQPLNGVVTGFVFKGKGRLHFEVPSAFERAQLKRFSHTPTADGIDTGFSAMIVRGVSPGVAGVVTPPAGATYAINTLAQDRRDAWVRDWDVDADARVFAASLNPHDGFFLADVKTDQYGWLSVMFEPWDAEELTVSKLPSAGYGVERWVSLDQAAERDARGDPTSDIHRLFDVTHAEISADLGNHRGELLVGTGPPKPDPIDFRVRVDVTVQRDALLALPFELGRRAELAAVRGADGSSLPFLRDNYGKRLALVANEESVGSVIVLLDRPTTAGDRLSFEFDYRMRTLNFVSGRDWYPGPVDAFRDPHTVRATIVGNSRLQVRAVGDLVSDTVAGSRRTTVWTMDRPTKMYGFSFGEKFKEESIKLEGAPEVLVFGVSTGVVFGKMVRNVAVDVARSQKFFQEYFGFTPPNTVLRATTISGYHGQAFEGFLHLAQDTFNEEHPGFSERFRAHEVAHQYWGHIVGWKGYRDQWLSEGFAEYSALLFVEAVLPREKFFDPMIEDFTAFQLGSIRGGTVGYDPTYANSIKPDLRAEIGPIAAGYRASTTRVPGGYQIQCYEKGALVLHTIRTVLASMAHDRDLFRQVLGDFIKTYQGKDASTADFIQFLQQRIPFAWGPFFDAYVYGTDIPTFAWRWSVAEESTGRVLSLSVQASRVPEGFTLPIPLAVDFGGGQVKYTFILMDAATKVFNIPVPAKPVKVTLNPRHGVLARMEPLKGS